MPFAEPWFPKLVETPKGALIPRSLQDVLGNYSVTSLDRQMEAIESYASKFREPKVLLTRTQEGGLEALISRGETIITHVTWSKQEYLKALPRDPDLRDYFQNDRGLLIVSGSMKFLTSYDFRCNKAHKSGGRLVEGLPVEYMVLGKDPHYYLKIQTSEGEEHWVFYDGYLKDIVKHVIAEVGGYVEKHVLTGMEIYHRLARPALNEKTP